MRVPRRDGEDIGIAVWGARATRVSSEGDFGRPGNTSRSGKLNSGFAGGGASHGVIDMSNAVAVTVFEAGRQLGFAGGE